MINIDWDTMPNLPELTLVVPTYTRHNHALRQMHFWSDSPVTLHVLDGTNKPIESERLKSIGDNVHYHHLPYSYEERFGRSIEFIDTPYVSLLCDDEFFIPSALNHCIEELKAHKDFVAYAGRCLDFYSTKKGIVAKPAYLEMKDYRSFGTKSGDRMIKHMNPYVHSALYAVHRSEIWKKNMAILSKKKFSTPYGVEVQFELATSYQGKSMVTEELMWLKNKKNTAIDIKEFDRKLYFHEWIKDTRYTDEVNFFYKNMTTELTKIDGADIEKVQADFKLAVEAYLDFFKNERLPLSYIKLRNRLMTTIPQKLKRELEEINVIFRWRQIIKEAEKMQKDGVTVDIKQLQEIVDFIEKFNEKHNLKIYGKNVKLD